MIQLAQATTPAQLARARELFEEYARSLDFALCFQSFDEELAGLPGDYAPPRGRLLLAYRDGELAGCGAIHPFGDAAENICELKRMWVRPEFRQCGVGRQLATTLIHAAQNSGYRAMRLDTIGATMHNAVTLYRSLGFREIPPYRENPIPGALYMELPL